MPNIDVGTLLSLISTVATVVGAYYGWCYRRELRAFIRSAAAKGEGKF